MNKAKPFDFNMLDASAKDYDVDKVIDTLEQAVDPDLVQRLNTVLEGAQASTAAATLAVMLSAVTALVCKHAPESVACSVHDNLARFSHVHLHAILHVQHAEGTYPGPLDALPHNKPSIH